MAEFYKGFVFELDVVHRLTIEGNQIDARNRSSGKGVTVRLPSGKRIVARTMSDLARLYIDSSGEVERREETRRAHLRILRRGREAWNSWRRRRPEVQPMLAAHDFTVRDSHRSLDGYDFSYTNFTEAILTGLSLRRANFHQAILAKANLGRARLQRANFCRTDLYQTNLEGAWLTGANLQGVQFAKTNLTRARLRRCTVYGLSAWDLDLDGADQRGLVIHYEHAAGGRVVERTVNVNGVDLAAFMYLTLSNKNIARIIEGATQQWVLLLGRFSRDKHVLRALEEALKSRGFIPVIFDFERAPQRDLVETIMLLAGLSRFVVVNITDPQSTPLELQAIAPHFAVPVVPIVKRGTPTFGMFPGLLKFRWVRAPIKYDTADQLIARLDSTVIVPALREEARLLKWKAAAEAD